MRLRSWWRRFEGRGSPGEGSSVKLLGGGGGGGCVPTQYVKRGPLHYYNTKHFCACYISISGYMGRQSHDLEKGFGKEKKDSHPRWCNRALARVKRHRVVKRPFVVPE